MTIPSSERAPLTREAAEALAAELVGEMIRGWRQGQRLLPEDFRARHPALWEHPEAVADLIYEELCLRREHGPEVPPEQVLRRLFRAINRQGTPPEPGQPGAVVVSAAIPVPAEPERELSLPPMLALSDMSPSTAEVVLAINRLGAIHRVPILASMYRHLAHWPAYLALVWTVLAPLKFDRRLDRAIEDAIAQARARAWPLVAQLPTPLPGDPAHNGTRRFPINRPIYRGRDRENGRDLFDAAPNNRQLMR